jgi:hypothetical protein
MMPEVHAKKITETIKEKQYKRVQIVSAVSQMEIILTDVMTDNFKKAA